MKINHRGTEAQRAERHDVSKACIEKEETGSSILLRCGAVALFCIIAADGMAQSAAGEMTMEQAVQEALARSPRL